MFPLVIYPKPASAEKPSSAVPYPTRSETRPCSGEDRKAVGPCTTPLVAAVPLIALDILASDGAAPGALQVRYHHSRRLGRNGWMCPKIRLRCPPGATGSIVIILGVVLLVVGTCSRYQFCGLWGSSWWSSG